MTDQSTTMQKITDHSGGVQTSAAAKLVTAYGVDEQTADQLVGLIFESGRLQGVSEMVDEFVRTGSILQAHDAALARSFGRVN